MATKLILLFLCCIGGCLLHVNAQNELIKDIKTELAAINKAFLNVQEMHFIAKTSSYESMYNSKPDITQKIIYHKTGDKSYKEIPEKLVEVINSSKMMIVNHQRHQIFLRKSVTLPSLDFVKKDLDVVVNNPNCKMQFINSNVSDERIIQMVYGLNGSQSFTLYYKPSNYLITKIETIIPGLISELENPPPSKFIIEIEYSNKPDNTDYYSFDKYIQVIGPNNYTVTPTFKQYSLINSLPANQ